jgi:hypothetical protein
LAHKELRTAPPTAKRFPRARRADTRPVEEASLPLHLVARESGETEQAVARLVAGHAELWDRYSGWLASLHPAAFEEVKNMAKGTRGQLRLDLTPVIETMGMDWLIEQVGAKEVIEHVGAKKFIEQLGAKEFLRQLGPKRLIAELGGVEGLLAELTPDQRRQLRRLLSNE